MENLLPILMHACPDDFSTVVYFDVSVCIRILLSTVAWLKKILQNYIDIHFSHLQTLNTTEIGRLVIYAPIVNSTMNLIQNVNMGNGVAVIGRKQTAGVGRHNNQVNKRDFFLYMHKFVSEKLP